MGLILFQTGASALNIGLAVWNFGNGDYGSAGINAAFGVFAGLFAILARD